MSANISNHAASGGEVCLRGVTTDLPRPIGLNIALQIAEIHVKLTLEPPNGLPSADATDSTGETAQNQASNSGS